MYLAGGYSGNLQPYFDKRKAGKMTSTYLTGVFKTDATARAEFMRFVNQ